MSSSDADSFSQAMLRGLQAPRKTTPPKFLYDETGSALFERICELEEYHVYRSELAVLQAHAAEIAGLLERAEGGLLLEFGSGAATKTDLLLVEVGDALTYVPIDISREALAASSARLARRFPRLRLRPVCADFSDWQAVTRALPATHGQRSAFFPGSTIGNFNPDEARAFFSGAAALLGRGGVLIIGVDLEQDEKVLEAAYNDRQGVTAAFNLNLLARMNRELGADFELAAFEHRAIFNARESRIEMHLVSRTRQRVHVAGRPVDFAAGETIHTESSYKYTPARFSELARGSGFEILSAWTDPRGTFAIYALAAGAARETRRRSEAA